MITYDWQCDWTDCKHVMVDKKGANTLIDMIWLIIEGYDTG